MVIDIIEGPFEIVLVLNPQKPGNLPLGSARLRAVNEYFTSDHGYWFQKGRLDFNGKMVFEKS